MSHKRSKKSGSVIVNPGQGVLVPLYGGSSAIVSEADYEKVRDLSWHRGGSAGQYASHSGKGHRVYMHQVILPVGAGLTVDHINGNTLDNRRENLRPATRAQQAMNRKPRAGGRSKGVVKSRRQWRVCVDKGGSRWEVHLYSHTLATMCYDDVAHARFGEFARPNFDETISRRVAARLIANTHGRVFSVVFSARKDGRQRKMTCRIGARVRLKGAALAFDPYERGLIPVFDMKNNGYRFIPKERILCLTIHKTRYAVRAPGPRNARTQCSTNSGTSSARIAASISSPREATESSPV